MAYHNLYLKNPKEFFELMKQRDPDLILKMTKCVLNAAKKGKEKVDIFEITFKDTSELTFSIIQPNYKSCLENCINDIAAMEDFDLCIEIKRFLNKKPLKKEKIIGGDQVFDS